MIEQKVDVATVESMIADKVSKGDVLDLIPNQDAIDKRLISICEEQVDNVWLKLDEKLVTWDQRLLNIRQEFDRAEINQLIETKASAD